MLIPRFPSSGDHVRIAFIEKTKAVFLPSCSRKQLSPRHQESASAAQLDSINANNAFRLDPSSTSAFVFPLALRSITSPPPFTMSETSANAQVTAPAQPAAPPAEVASVPKTAPEAATETVTAQDVAMTGTEPSKNPVQPAGEPAKPVEGSSPNSPLNLMSTTIQANIIVLSQLQLNLHQRNPRRMLMSR